MKESFNISDPHGNQPVINTGKKPGEARAVMIMIHGRGATAESIISLSGEIKVDDTAYLAPQANNYTWYPYSFLSPIEMNEPGITSGLRLIDSMIEGLLKSGLASERIFLLGFSQGACLSLEYAARNPRRFGGVIGLSGGLIGPPGSKWNDKGDFKGTPVFLGCSDVDPHIPIKRVTETENVFRSMNANVTKRIYNGMGHTINQDEIEFVRNLMENRNL